VSDGEDVPDRLGAFLGGARLVQRGSPAGALGGLRFAVKDLFDVAGLPTGAGNPEFLAEARPASSNASAVEALLAEGADLWGKTVTDELAFSLSGTNVHYGMARNVAAPGRVPGGSSSGSASAVAAGVVDVALGTDTGGSIRVPASYCGIYGVRPSHGRVSVAGVVPLAPRFDVVGVLSSRSRWLVASTRALLAHAPGEAVASSDGRGGDAESCGLGGLSIGQERDTPPRRAAVRRLVVLSDLWALADPATQAVLRRRVRRLADDLGGLRIVEGEIAGAACLEQWSRAFRSLQLAQAWASHAAFIERAHPSFGPGVASRFAAAARVDPAEVSRAEPVAAAVRRRLAEVTGDDGICCQPVTTGPAPRPEIAEEEKADLRARTICLGAPAGLAGAPVVVVPGARAYGLPVGLGIVGNPGDDELLLDLVAAAER
jgi:amidase